MNISVSNNDTSTGAPQNISAKKQLLYLSLGALGVVFGDIGTSPLYALKECFAGHFALAVTETNVLGILSLIFWSLMIVVTVKYVAFMMRADNDGEGGIFSLLGLLERHDNASTGSRLAMLAIVGAALLYADGVITPAISVLSAMEGLGVATDELNPYILPGTALILASLFLFQSKGTGALGTLFGPVILLWMATLSIAGLGGIIAQPHVLAAINPLHAVRFFMVNHFHGFAVLGSVILCVTGGEALYADMGHFGARAIRLAWLYICLPALVLNYFGQGALLLSNPTMVTNPFYGLIPSPLLIPMVILSTVATVIASQAMITGVFSLTRQAVQLGFLPRLNIIYTNASARGQIYVPNVNWMMMIACLALVVFFRSSSNLAGAYGIAVTATMAMTSILYYRVATRLWKWNPIPTFLLVGLFLMFDLSFFFANLLKIMSGGWVTMLIAALIIWMMLSWHAGNKKLKHFYGAISCSIHELVEGLQKTPVQRVPGTAVFLGGVHGTAPISLLQHLKHNKALHDQVIILGIDTTSTPTVAPEERLMMQPMSEGITYVVAHFGFMETPDMTSIIRLLGECNINLSHSECSFYLGRVTLNNTGDSGMNRYKRILFVAMTRNAWDAARYFRIPANRIVEIGIQMDI